MKILICRHPHGVIREIGKDAYLAHCGQLVTPRGRNTPTPAAKVGASWAMDNDAFKAFDRTAFIKCLRSAAGMPNCLFVAVPDVVANAVATLVRFRMWQPALRYFGFPPALVAQDGLEHLAIDWNSFDALFIGGSTDWKLSEHAARLVKAAKARGKHVHMGRVNSAQRIAYAQGIGCDSVDGTGWAQFSKSTLPLGLKALTTPFTMPLWTVEAVS